MDGRSILRERKARRRTTSTEMSVGFIESSDPVLQQDMGLLGEEEKKRPPMTHGKEGRGVESS